VSNEGDQGTTKLVAVGVQSRPLTSHPLIFAVVDFANYHPTTQHGAPVRSVVVSERIRLAKTAEVAVCNLSVCYEPSPHPYLSFLRLIQLLNHGPA